MTTGRRTPPPVPGPVAPQKDEQATDRAAKASKGSSNSKGQAQRRYQREALLSRAFLRDHMPKEFERIAKQVGRRRPTFKMNKKRKKGGGNGGERGAA